MENKEILSRLEEIIRILHSAKKLPGSPLESTQTKPPTIENYSDEKLVEVLDYIRICSKYRMFDMEATIRENNYLRRMLKDKDSE